ncbi:hypothetical protein EDB19DRAFT_2029755 [Suillus lakei]|nr:hypothetical protein EDB19DRAFT_2029755 [Suillus lakei]
MSHKDADSRPVSAHAQQDLGIENFGAFQVLAAFRFGRQRKRLTQALWSLARLSAHEHSKLFPLMIGQNYPKSLTLLKPLRAVEHPTPSVNSNKLMGVVKSSDAIATPAIAAAVMTIVVVYREQPSNLDVHETDTQITHHDIISLKVSNNVLVTLPTSIMEHLDRTSLNLDGSNITTQESIYSMLDVFLTFFSPRPLFAMSASVIMLGLVPHISRAFDASRDNQAAIQNTCALTKFTEVYEHFGRFLSSISARARVTAGVCPAHYVRPLENYVVGSFVPKL